MKNLLKQVDYEKPLLLCILWKIFISRYIMEDLQKQVDYEKAFKKGRL